MESFALKPIIFDCIIKTQIYLHNHTGDEDKYGTIKSGKEEEYKAFPKPREFS
jgi:hypothetical protein